MFGFISLSVVEKTMPAKRPHPHPRANSTSLGLRYALNTLKLMQLTNANEQGLHSYSSFFGYA